MLPCQTIKNQIKQLCLECLNVHVCVAFLIFTAKLTEVLLVNKFLPFNGLF